MKKKLFIIFVSVLAVLHVCKADEESDFHQYCVIGAGPSGLQIGYFLENVGRDYIIFEKGAASGTFYTKYPIHRTLISINKRFTGKTNKEFNWRHDWNSLLSHDESLQMTKYSKEFFPDADVLVKYLNDFTSKLGLKVQYNTEIENLRKRTDGIFQMNDQQNSTYTCKYVIIATGIAVPKLPTFSGSEYVEGYENLTLDLESYEGQSVLILGRGNAAFEVAQHIMPATNSIHMMGRSRVKLAWATHYVGDLRAINDGLLDTYQLKSLDGLYEGSVEDMSIVKSKLNGRYYLVSPDDKDPSPGGTDFFHYDNDAAREGYDRVIRCLGFTFDDSIFHPDMTIRHCKGSKRKYPYIRYSYESIDIRDLYFVGANTHSLDFRKSAGAFIHGYRYTARTLHRILEWRNHENKWPSVHFENLLDLLPHILKRVNEASDIYQMFGVLCEVVIYNKDMTEATYLEAYPCALGSRIPQISGHDVPGAVMIVALEYGKNFSGPDKDPFHLERATGDVDDAHNSNFLHPVLYHYKRSFTNEDYLSRPKQWLLPVPDRLHHIVEDFTTKFDAQKSHILSLRRFIETCTGHDLRFFFGKHCMMLAMTTKNLPLSCRNFNDSSSNLLIENDSMTQQLLNMPGYILPFEILE